MRRQVTSLFAIAALAAACGKGSSGGSGSGSGGVGGGATAGSGAATIELPPGVDAKAITVVAKPPTELPASVMPYREMLDKEFVVHGIVELGPDGTKLPAAGKVTITIDPKTLPAGHTLANMRAVSASADGTLEDLTIAVTGADRVTVEVAHFSWILVASTLVGVAVIGGFAGYMKGASESINRTNCGDWLTPGSPKVAELAKDESRFAIDLATGAIKLVPALKGKDVDQGAHMLKADQVLERGYGDCVNMSTLVGSALVAKGYPVKLVSGGAHYRSNGKDVQGLHQWAETVIDGKPYYVDTFEPSAIKLRPLHEASAELKLTRMRMCGQTGGGKYDARWYDAHEAGVGDDWVKLTTEMNDLKSQHKALVKLCAADATNQACVERKKVYDRAIEIQEKLRAMGKLE